MNKDTTQKQIYNCPHCNKPINPAAMLRQSGKPRGKEFYKAMADKRWSKKRAN